MRFASRFAHLFTPSRPAFHLAAGIALATLPALTFAAPHTLAVPTTLEGQVVVTVEDYPDHSVTRHTLQTQSGDVELLLNDATAIQAGSTIRVSGQRAGSLMAVATGSVATVAPAPPALTLGAQKTLVMLVNFTDNASQPWTVTDVKNRVFGDASNFYLENSFQQTWLTGDVAGWYALPLTATCDATSIATAAKQAASTAGINLSAYSHYVYAYPANSQCGMSGQSTIGGNPSEVWINGDISLHTVAHELGHSFGLYHSHALVCSSGVIGGTCSVDEYGDRLDIMGITGTSHFNAFQKERLGWLNYGAAPTINTAQASGSYTIDPYETAGTGAKALKILKSTDATTGAKTWYYIEYRQAVGFDAALASMPYANFQNGVIVHVGSDSDGHTSDILNMTPQSSVADWNDVALVAGQSYTDSAAGVTITTSWANTTNAGVSVTLSAPVPPPPPTCTHANPTVSISGSTQSVTPGSTLSYTVTVTNKDSSACANGAFALSGSLPSGWSGSFAATSLTLAPGASASTTWSVSSSSTASAGGYNIGVTAASGSDTASATAVYSVATTTTSRKHGK